MIVGRCEAHLIFRPSSSLKDKRRAMKSILDRLRNRFNIAAAETGDLDDWKRATVGIACVSNNATHAREVLTEALRWIEDNVDGEIWDYDIDVI